ncbi:MAG: 4'-phosphopantetheinyl transferase superfamily protein [Dyella sp.]
MAWHAVDPATVAKRLGEHEIHLWRLPYRPALRRAPLLALLAAYLQCPAEAIALRQGEYGRPALALEQPHTLDFNWSHSGEQALVAIAHGIAPGIDLERIRPRRSAMEIARRYFAADELAWLETIDERASRELAFLRLWTAKEAVLKAHGRGIAFGLDRLSIDMRQTQPHLLRLEHEHVEHWQLHALPLGQDYLGALAWRGAPRTLRGHLLAGNQR